MQGIKSSSSWLYFTIGAFILSVAMMAGGIYNLDASFAAKGFYAMAAIMLVHTSITITKTIRDIEESEKFLNKIEDAKTEKLLRGIAQDEEA